MRAFAVPIFCCDSQELFWRLILILMVWRAVLRGWHPPPPTPPHQPPSHSIHPHPHSCTSFRQKGPRAAKKPYHRFPTPTPTVAQPPSISPLPPTGEPPTSRLFNEAKASLIKPWLAAGEANARRSCESNSPDVIRLYLQLVVGILSFDLQISVERPSASQGLILCALRFLFGLLFDDFCFT